MNRTIIITSLLALVLFISFMGVAEASDDDINWDVTAGFTASYTDQTVEIEGTIHNPSDKNTKNVAILARITHDNGTVLRDFSITVGKVEGGDTKSFSHTEYNMGFKLGEQLEVDTEWYDIDYEVESGCLVATATYGSELSPQVQFLRSFRDHRVLSTFAGSQFMKVFNNFYYSWSPHVADSIRASDGFGTVMKGVLYPLIAVLQVSESVFTALSFNPELGIITAGFVASALLATVYIAPLAIVFTSVKRFRQPKMLLAAMTLIWLASLTAIGLAEVTQMSALMTIATGTFVLATMGTTVLGILRQTSKTARIH